MKILAFFDKLEDKIRFTLSKHPFIYTFLGGVGIVLFWRGVWMTADLFPFLSGPVSLILSTILLMLLGLFVSFFIGDEIIIKGLKQEKKIVEKSAKEVEQEEATISEIKKDIQEIDKHLEHIERDIKKK